MDVFDVEGGKVTIDNGILEVWSGGASWGRYRLDDLPALEPEETKKGKLRLRFAPSAISVSTSDSTRGVTVDLTDKAQFDALLAGIEENKRLG